MAISWYDLSICCVGMKMLPGDCHGPNGPRNDTVAVGGLRSRYFGNQQFTSLTDKKARAAKAARAGKNT